ncbi:hypothetical protein P9112_012595 [Eukaryota sp. TZLM1-RC]
MADLCPRLCLNCAPLLIDIKATLSKSMSTTDFSAHRSYILNNPTYNFCDICRDSISVWLGSGLHQTLTSSHHHPQRKLFNSSVLLAVVYVLAYFFYGFLLFPSSLFTKSPSVFSLSPVCPVFSNYLGPLILLSCSIIFVIVNGFNVFFNCIIVCYFIVSFFSSLKSTAAHLLFHFILLLLSMFNIFERFSFTSSINSISLDVTSYYVPPTFFPTFNWHFYQKIFFQFTNFLCSFFSFFTQKDSNHPLLSRHHYLFAIVFLVPSYFSRHSILSCLFVIPGVLVLFSLLVEQFLAKPISFTLLCMVLLSFVMIFAQVSVWLFFPLIVLIIVLSLIRH